MVLSFGTVVLLVLFVTLAVFIGKLSRRRRAGHSYRSEHIIVFTRYPEPGLAKTRLIPELGEAGAATAQLYLVWHGHGKQGCQRYCSISRLYLGFFYIFNDREQFKKTTWWSKQNCLSKQKGQQQEDCTH